MCLDQIAESCHSNIFTVVLDDGSTDGTDRLVRENYPEVAYVRGDGSYWWAKSNNICIEVCLENNCDYILLLNPDAFLTPSTISNLLVAAKGKDRAIIASLVVNHDDPGKVAWAGSRWGKPYPLLPVYCSRYIHKKNTDVKDVGSVPYLSSEAHGRGVLYPKAVFNEVGYFDDRNLPQYGADVDYSLRVCEAGYEIWVVPQAVTHLLTQNSGMALQREVNPLEDFRTFYRFLFKQKNGDMVRVWWHLTAKHVPTLSRFPTLFFIVSLNIFRFWQRAFSRYIKALT